MCLNWQKNYLLASNRQTCFGHRSSFPKCSSNRLMKNPKRNGFCLAVVNFPAVPFPQNEPNKKRTAPSAPSFRRQELRLSPYVKRLHFIHLAPLSAPTLNVTAVPQESIDYIDPWGSTGYIFMRQETAVLKSYIKEGHRWRWLVGDRDTLGFLHHHLHLSLSPTRMYAGLKWVYQPDLVVGGLIISMPVPPPPPTNTTTATHTSPGPVPSPTLQQIPSA